MLTPRNAIVVAALLFAALVISSVFSSLAPPQSDGTGPDSYNRRREGTHALVALLEELGVPAQRVTDPPSVDLPLDTTLLLVAPDSMLVRTDPEPLRRMGEWVERGGRVVVAPDFSDEREQKRLERLASQLKHYNRDVLEALGLEGVRAVLLPDYDVPTQTPPDDRELRVSKVADSTDGPAAGELQELVTLGAALPEVLFEDDTPPLWQTRILDARGKERTLAAGFRRGQGEIVVLGDATLLSNAVLSRGQNAYWLSRILPGEGRSRCVIDEFYHGHAVRGNAWWLLTRPAYAMLAVCGLMLLGLWTWRSGVLLGPPLADRSPSRRAIGEYIDAMGRFLLRGRDSQRFLLEQIREGVWRRLSHETGLPPGQNDLERLVAAHARRDPQRARHVREAFTTADHTLSRSRASATDRLVALQRLQACVSVEETHSRGSPASSGLQPPPESQRPNHLSATTTPV